MWAQRRDQWLWLTRCLQWNRWTQVTDTNDFDLGEEDSFRDAQRLLDDYHGSEDNGEVFLESDIPKVLASTCRMDCQSELSRLQKSRQFAKAREVRRAFRVEVEEAKAGKSCNWCGQKTYWARMCPQPKRSTKGKPKKNHLLAPLPRQGQLPW